MCLCPSSESDSSKQESSKSESSKTPQSSSSSSKPDSSKNESSKPTPKPQHTHSWTNITEKVKVVDKKAYSYEEPVYETKSRVICNDCGADITDLGESGIRWHTGDHSTFCFVHRLLIAVCFLVNNFYLFGNVCPTVCMLRLRSRL